MSRRPVFSVLLLPVVVAQQLCAVHAADSSDPSESEALRIEQKILEARERLQTGIVKFEVTTTRGARTSTAQHEVTFDGDRIRHDVWQALPVQESDGSTTSNSSVWHYIYTDDAQILWSPRISPEGRNMAVHLIHMNTDVGRAHGNKVDQAYRLDPRLLGIVPGEHDYLHATSLRDWLTRPDRKASRVEHVPTEDGEFVRIEYDRNDGRTVVFLLDPLRGLSVVEASVIVPSKFVDRIENTLDDVGTGENPMWYPKTVRYTRSFGPLITTESVLTVTRAEFNTPVEESVFSLQALSIPVGVHAHETPVYAGGTRYWDGETFQSIHEQMAEWDQSGPPIASKGIWLILANVLFILAIACVIVWWRGRSVRT